MSIYDKKSHLARFLHLAHLIGTIFREKGCGELLPPHRERLYELEIWNTLSRNIYKLIYIYKVYSLKFWNFPVSLGFKNGLFFMPFPHKMMEKKQAHVPSPGSQIPPPVKKDATRYTSGPKFSTLNAIKPIYFLLSLLC